MQKYSEFIVACRNFLKNPTKEYFKDRIINTDKKELLDEFEKRGTKCYVLSFNVPELPDDVIYPQITKTMNSFINVSEMYDFNIIESNYFIDSNNIANIILEYTVDKLSNVKIHQGPLVKYNENGFNFKEKYPQAYIKNNKWIAVSERKYKTVQEMVENIVKKENRSILKLGKNIKDEISQNYKFESIEKIIKKEDNEYLDNIFMHIHPDYKLKRD